MTTDQKLDAPETIFAGMDSRHRCEGMWECVPFDIHPDSPKYIRFDAHERTLQAAVAKAVEAERERAKLQVWSLGHAIRASLLVDEDREQAVLEMVKETAAAISRGVAP